MSAVLVGYLSISGETLGDTKIETLFEFPENLIKQSFFTTSTEKQYSLKKEVVADYIDKNEFGKAEEIYYKIYDQEGKYPTNFHFTIE